MKLLAYSAMATAIALAGCAGDDGDNGIDGLTALTSTTTLAAGSTECANGGLQITAGLDDNGNGALDSSEIDSTEVVCNGTDAPISKAIDLTILHMNDHHSHLEADDFDLDVSGLTFEAEVDNNGTSESIAEVTVTYGGFPMLVSLFDTLDSQNSNVLKLHSGDAVTGTLYYSLFAGVADADMMNQVCFDAFALGNHEFDNGDQGLAYFLDALNSSACQTPTLAANVTPGATSAVAEGYLQPYTTFEFEGETVGVIGIDIASKTKNSSFPDEDTLFADETTTAQQYIDELEAAGVNKIILMTHYQYSNDQTLAAALSGVDVIVGGDSHSLLGDSTFTDLELGTPSGDYPTLVTNADGDTVCVVQAWEYAHLLGKLDVSFDEDGVVTACSGQPVMPISNQYEYVSAIDSEGEETTSYLTGSDLFKVTQVLTSEDELVVTAEDSSTASALSVYKAEADILVQTVIGSATDDMCFERIPNQGRSSLCSVSDTYLHGSDITGQVAKGFVTVTPTADIAIQNGGGVRVDIANGDVTIADAYTLMPFSNTLVTLEMTGAEIKSLLEDAADYALDATGSTGAYPYAYGMRFDVDLSQAKGSRFSNIEVNARGEGSWTSMEDTTLYTVVTNNYIAAGQDGYDTFGDIDESRYVDTYTEYAQSFVDYMNILTDNSETLQKLETSEYSTQTFIDTDGCNHSLSSNCTYATDGVTN